MGLLETLGLEVPKALGTTGGSAPLRSAAGDLAGTGAPAKQGGATPVSSKEVTDYADKRKAVKALVDALNGHAQAGRITSQLGRITTTLAQAAAHATALEWPQAMAQLEAARQLCVQAKTLADDWQKYVTKLASTKAQISALSNVDDAAAATAQGNVNAAETEVKKSPPNFVLAMQKLDLAFGALKPLFRAKLNGIKNAYAKLTAMTPQIQAFLVKEMTAGKALVDQCEAAYNAEQWSQMLISWMSAWDAIGGAERYGQRRSLYETQLAKTQADVAAVKALPAVQDRGALLDRLLARAAALASRDQLKIEEGTAVLKDASARCDKLKAIAPTVAAYRTERPLAEQECAALEKDAAAAHVRETITAIRALLTAAATSATQAAANEVDPTAAWQAALTGVKRARADLATAKGLATSLGPTAAAETAAKGGDAAAMKAALAKLQADLAAAGKAAHADLAKKPLEKAAKEAADVKQALDKGNAKAAARSLQDAAAALGEARTVQAMHTRFVADLAAVEARHKALATLPHAAKIGPKVEAAAKAIEAAKKQDRKQEGDEAIAALRAADAAVAAAEQANRDRAAFETEATRVGGRITSQLSDAKQQKAVTGKVDDARKRADDFKWDEARKLLKKAEQEIGQIRLKAAMATNPPAGNLSDIAKQLVKDGDPKTVDDAIQNVPKNAPATILALASGRYGKPFRFSDANPGEHQIKSLKRVCEIFAKIPEDLANNPSIKDVSHEDATNSAGGGYTASSGHIGMVGRVGIQQRFGNDEEHWDPKTKKDVPSLPKNIPKECQPKGGKMEYLGFAAAHEVGHGVDDKRGFMAKNGHLEKYGGWVDYGASVQPIADAVGNDIAGKFKGSKFYRTPETRQYVLDKIMSKPATPPAVVSGSDDWKALRAFNTWHALATASDVYRREADCVAITIGTRIYHEAYPRQWVSYLAAARSKGLTGYQFRSPAEWFAELYAGWKSGKLGDKHPALEWLTKL